MRALSNGALGPEDPHPCREALLGMVLWSHTLTPEQRAAATDVIGSWAGTLDDLAAVTRALTPVPSACCIYPYL